MTPTLQTRKLSSDYQCDWPDGAGRACRAEAEPSHPTSIHRFSCTKHQTSWKMKTSQSTSYQADRVPNTLFQSSNVLFQTQFNQSVCVKASEHEGYLHCLVVLSYFKTNSKCITFKEKSWQALYHGKEAALGEGLLCRELFPHLPSFGPVFPTPPVRGKIHQVTWLGPRTLAWGQLTRGLALCCPCALSPGAQVRRPYSRSPGQLS